MVSLGRAWLYMDGLLYQVPPAPSSPRVVRSVSRPMRSPYIRRSRYITLIPRKQTGPIQFIHVLSYCCSAGQSTRRFSCPCSSNREFNGYDNPSVSLRPTGTVQEEPLSVLSTTNQDVNKLPSGSLTYKRHHPSQETCHMKLTIPKPCPKGTNRKKRTKNQKRVTRFVS